MLTKYMSSVIRGSASTSAFTVTKQVRWPCSYGPESPCSSFDLCAAKAIEYMIVDALLAAEPHMNFARDIFNPKRYLHLTDDIRIRIEASEAPVRLILFPSPPTHSPSHRS